MPNDKKEEDTLFAFDDEDEMTGVSKPVPLPPKMPQPATSEDEFEDELPDFTPEFEVLLGRFMPPGIAKKIFESSGTITELEVKNSLTLRSAAKLGEALLEPKNTQLLSYLPDESRIILVGAIAAIGKDSAEEQKLTDLANKISLEVLYNKLDLSKRVPVQLRREYCSAFGKNFSSPTQLADKGTTSKEAHITKLAECLSYSPVLTEPSEDFIENLQKSLDDTNAEKLKDLLIKDSYLTQFSAEQFKNIIRILSGSTTSSVASKNARSKIINDLYVTYLEKATDSSKKTLDPENQKAFIAGVKEITDVETKKSLISLALEKNNYRPNRFCVWLSKTFPKIFATGTVISPWVLKNSLSPLGLNEENIKSLQDIRDGRIATVARISLTPATTPTSSIEEIKTGSQVVKPHLRRITTCWEYS